MKKLHKHKEILQPNAPVQVLRKNFFKNKTSQRNNEESVSRFVGEGNPNVEEKIIEAQGKNHAPQTSFFENPSTPSYEDRDELGQAYYDDELNNSVYEAIDNDKPIAHIARDIEIIVEKGMVTLKGEVASEGEKVALGNKVALVVGQENIINQIEVIQEKKF